MLESARGSPPRRLEKRFEDQRRLQQQRPAVRQAASGKCAHAGERRLSTCGYGAYYRQLRKSSKKSAPGGKLFACVMIPTLLAPKCSIYSFSGPSNDTV